MTAPISFILWTTREHLTFQSYDKQRKLYFYTYTQSDTKLGLTTPYTEEHLNDLLAIQQIFKPVEFFDTNFEL